jgi:hypothetical protein
VLSYAASCLVSLCSARFLRCGLGAASSVGSPCPPTLALALTLAPDGSSTYIWTLESVCACIASHTEGTVSVGLAHVVGHPCRHETPATCPATCETPKRPPATQSPVRRMATASNQTHKKPLTDGCPSARPQIYQWRQTSPPRSDLYART